MAKKYGVTLRTLRFYEDKGLLSPKRDGTTRLYTRRDSRRLKLILLGRKVGFSLREVKQIMDLYDPSGSNTKQLQLALEKSEKQLGRLRKAARRDRRGDCRTDQADRRRPLACWPSASSRRPRRPDHALESRGASYRRAGLVPARQCVARLGLTGRALPYDRDVRRVDIRPRRNPVCTLKLTFTQTSKFDRPRCVIVRACRLAGARRMYASGGT